MITRYQRNELIKEFLPSIGMAVISFILCIYAILPGIQHVQQQWENQQTIASENDLLKKKVNTLMQFDEDTLSQYVSILMTAVPSDKSIASILTTIENVALKNNIALTDLSIANPGSISTDAASIKVNNSKLGSNTIKIQINVLGGKEDIFAFISTIRSVRRLIRVAGISQTFSESEASSSSRTKLDLEAFYAPLPQTLGKIDSPISQLSANEEELITKLSQYPLEFGMETPGDTLQIESGNKIDPFSF